MVLFSVLLSCPGASLYGADWEPRAQHEPERAGVQWPHPPLVQEKPTFVPLPHPYAYPVIAPLTSDAELETVTLTNRTWTIVRVSESDENAPGLHYNASGEALYFNSGKPGLDSTERLVVEDCTFIIDFQEGDFDNWRATRCALFVKGYREVVVRRCRFVSKGHRDDPDRKTNASLTAYDCRNVLVEDCTFEGVCNWMRGHVLVFCCGPTHVRRCEVAGVMQDGKWSCGGGIWVAHGLGERKLGWSHRKTPEKMLYPAGPAIVEDCYIHDQQGNNNTDAIYIQSVHNALVRNCRVENWKMDALIDIGFRDTGPKQYDGLTLANHGARAVVENCEFSGGFLKTSVGAAGGIVFRHCIFNDIWYMPYLFDGGNCYLLGNSFRDVTGPIISGQDHRTGGWAAAEGMLVNGSQTYLFGNTIETKPAASVSALIRNSSRKVAQRLAETIRSDYNVFVMPTPPKAFAEEAATGEVIRTIDAWREATGNDRNSRVADGPARLPVPADVLPEGFPARLLPNPNTPCGVIDPIGPRGVPPSPDLGQGVPKSRL